MCKIEAVSLNYLNVVALNNALELNDALQFLQFYILFMNQYKSTLYMIPYDVMSHY